MYLFLDTETTGVLPVERKSHSDISRYPRLVQIAWLLTDEYGNELRSQNFIVKPEGFQIPRSAARRHKITTETARKLGIPLGDALSALTKDIAAADRIVAHNVQFDALVLAGEFQRVGITPSPLEAAKPYCTMVSSTRICGLRNGPKGYKWPTLLELHTFLFGDEYRNAHNALADVRACAKCFFELKQRGVDFDSAFDIQILFDELYEYADHCPWFNTRKFVDDVYAQFLASGSISAKQRAAIISIRDMLREKSEPARIDARQNSGANTGIRIDASSFVPASLRAMLSSFLHQWRT
jgi:DNA polymerase III epsilon subunit-like protein